MYSASSSHFGSDPYIGATHTLKKCSGSVKTYIFKLRSKTIVIFWKSFSFLFFSLSKSSYLFHNMMWWYLEVSFTRRRPIDERNRIVRSVVWLLCQRDEPGPMLSHAVSDAFRENERFVRVVERFSLRIVVMTIDLFAEPQIVKAFVGLNLRVQVLCGDHYGYLISILKSRQKWNISVQEALN